MINPNLKQKHGTLSANTSTSCDLNSNYSKTRQMLQKSYFGVTEKKYALIFSIWLNVNLNMRIEQYNVSRRRSALALKFGGRALMPAVSRVSTLYIYFLSYISFTFGIFAYIHLLLYLPF